MAAKEKSVYLRDLLEKDHEDAEHVEAVPLDFLTPTDKEEKEVDLPEAEDLTADVDETGAIADVSDLSDYAMLTAEKEAVVPNVRRLDEHRESIFEPALKHDDDDDYAFTEHFARRLAGEGDEC